MHLLYCKIRTIKFDIVNGKGIIFFMSLFYILNLGNCLRNYRRIVICWRNVRRSAILIERRHVHHVSLYFHVLISSIGQSEARIVVGPSLIMSKNLLCLNVRGCRYRPTIITINNYCTTCVHERNICS